MVGFVNEYTYIVIALCMLKVQVVKLLITQLSPLSYYLLSLRSKLSPT
jgi:hypothetical protein